MVTTSNAMSVCWDRQWIVWRDYSWRRFFAEPNIKLTQITKPGNSILLGENITQPDLELVEERFQLVQGQVVFALLNPE